MLCFGLFVMICHATPAGVVPPRADYCLTARPVHPHAKDTRRTKEQADRELRKYKGLCPGMKP